MQNNALLVRFLWLVVIALVVVALIAQYTGHHDLAKTLILPALLLFWLTYAMRRAKPKQ
ncbi:hypothetical protein [Lacticaseibacillus sharpeae]|nr:hypothetical protein [Lacticaseibacillus sharpeae]